MEEIEAKLSSINEELMKLNSDLGYGGDHKRAFKRHYDAPYNKENEAQHSAKFPRINQYCIGVFQSPKRRQEPYHGDSRVVPHIENRGRFTHDEDGRHESQLDDDDELPPERFPKPTVQSTVVLRPVDSKSREQMIQEMVKTEKKEVVNRNRRMFSNLMSALTGESGRKLDVKTLENEKKMNEKLAEVENKMRNEKLQSIEQKSLERKKKMIKREELEMEVQSLTRKKALTQYAEAKKKHYMQMSNFIMTETKPSIFFFPAKHNVRSLELLNVSKETIQNLIDLRQKELERELDASFNFNRPSAGKHDHLKSFMGKGYEEIDDKSLSKKDRSPDNSENQRESNTPCHEEITVKIELDTQD